MSKLNSGANSGQAKRACDYRFSGIRRRDGMSIIQAFTWNVRTFVADAKGKRHKWRTHEAESTEAASRGGCTRSTDEPAVMGVEGRGTIIRFSSGGKLK
jgi:hypothetical protein